MSFATLCTCLFLVAFSHLATCSGVSVIIGVLAYGCLSSHKICLTNEVKYVLTLPLRLLDMRGGSINLPGCNFPVSTIASALLALQVHTWPKNSASFPDSRYL